MRFTFTRYPNQSLAHRAGSRTGRVRLFASRATDWSLTDDRIPIAHQPAEQCPAAVPFPSGMVGRLSRPQFRVEYEKTGVVTASDPIKRPLRLPRRSADGPTAQVRNAVTTTPNNNHKTSGRAHKRDDRRMPKGASSAWPISSSRFVDRASNFNTSPKGETCHEICASGTAARERDIEVDNCAQF
jgi:hypothetical protein